jgi:cellulose synthase/poly-beta-1,6-N-acetylglucosamine synthase-like glycosyltransferase
VTPSLNQGRFIEATIRSILLQGYPDLESFVIDGGSSDSTREIIARYSPWIDFAISEPDRGQSSAINRGLRYCFVGDTKQARRIFYQAIARYPLAGKTYMAALLSLTGSEGVRLGYATKAAVAGMTHNLLGRIRYMLWSAFGVTGQSSLWMLTNGDR